MAEPAKFMISFNASPGLIDDLKGIVEANPAVMKLESVGPSSESSHLRLGLTEVATLVTVLNGVATLAKFAYEIYKHLHDKKDEKVSVQSPLRTVVILASDATSAERVQELLQASLRA